MKWGFILSLLLAGLVIVAIAQDAPAAETPAAPVVTEDEEIEMPKQMSLEEQRKFFESLPEEEKQKYIKQAMEEQKKQLDAMTPEERQRFLEQQMAMQQKMQREQYVKSLSAPGTSVGYYFPDTANNTFVAGQQVTMVIGFVNAGPKTLHLTTVIATLYHPQEFRYQILNFTRLPLSISVEPGQDASITYTFLPDPYLDPRPFGLVAQLLYYDDVRNFSSVIFNNTIMIEEPLTSFDSQSFALIVGALALVAGGLYAGTGLFSSLRKTKKTAPEAKKPKKAASPDAQDEWLVGTAAGAELLRKQQKKKN